MRARRILIVCSGNTCRSPMAAALVAARAAGSGARIEVRSAGTTAGNGRPASAGAWAVMAERGLDIHGHRTARLGAGQLAWATEVWVMTRLHVTHIARRWPGPLSAHVGLLGEAAGDDGEVSDPLGGTLADYRRTADALERFVAGVMGRSAAGGRDGREA